MKLGNTATLGILGGGQLGRMMAMAAARLGIATVIYAPETAAVAADCAQAWINKPYDDRESLRKFAELCDVISIEFENVPAASLDFLQELTPVRPGPHVLRSTQDRLLEKNFVRGCSINTADYAPVASLDELLVALKQFGGDGILKTRRMGYDGRGQARLQNEKAAKKAFEKFQGHDLILEKLVPFDAEYSVICARSPGGSIRSFPLQHNIHQNHILYQTHVPAGLSEHLEEKAIQLAQQLAEAIKLEGLLAVEMFLVGDQFLVNELAPRPHNSGHWSLDGCQTSQFEQLVRAVFDLPLGATGIVSPSIMQNLLGEEIHDVALHLKNPDARIHIYGKDDVRTGRKMGHVNFLKS